MGWVPAKRAGGVSFTRRHVSSTVVRQRRVENYVDKEESAMTGKRDHFVRAAAAVVAAAALAAGCGGEAKKIGVTGDAFSFSMPGTPYGKIAGATVSLLEDPAVSVTTAADGTFAFAGLAAGRDATFVLTADGFPRAQTKTFTLPGADLGRVTFQVPPDDIYALIAGIVQVETDAAKCQIVTTVTRVGKSIYDAGAHGEAGATVAIAPALPAENGPIYFNASVIPDRALTESSDDGGVLFVNVPPGDYVLTATKPGVTFERLAMKCRAGTLVNASPPYGLQAL